MSRPNSLLAGLLLLFALGCGQSKDPRPAPSRQDGSQGTSLSVRSGGKYTPGDPARDILDSMKVMTFERTFHVGWGDLDSNSHMANTGVKK